MPLWELLQTKREREREREREYTPKELSKSNATLATFAKGERERERDRKFIVLKIT